MVWLSLTVGLVSIGGLTTSDGFIWLLMVGTTNNIVFQEFGFFL